MNTLALDLKDLHKVYKDGSLALDHVSLEVREGDFFGLLGPNGAGKTTLIGILTSLVNKSKGSVKVFGWDMDSHLEQVKSMLGLVPQEFNFNIFEKVENIIINQAGYYGIKRNEAQRRMGEYLKVLDLDDKRDVQASNLSGGMKRRLMIARSLIHKPRILILDEPTAGVDIELRHSMWAFLRDLNAQGTTIILTTHYLEEAESLCRNIAIIDHGKIIEKASTRSLIAKLHKESFIFDLKEPLESLSDLGPFHFRLPGSTTLEVDLEKKQELNSLFQELDKRGIKTLSMRNKASRLEKLFVGIMAKKRS